MQPLLQVRCRATGVGLPVILTHAFLPMLTIKAWCAICLQKFLPEPKWVLSLEKFLHQVDNCLCQKASLLAR